MSAHNAAAPRDAAHPFSFDPAHEAIIHSRAKTFVLGPFGSGKTALAIARARWLLRQERVRGDDLLILVPQPLNLAPFREALAGANAPVGAPVEITTVASVARNAVELYWPLIAPDAGFADPKREPTFLNVEMAQYYLGHYVDEAILQQAFSGLTIRRNRIVIQLITNMNRGTLYGFTIDEVYDRLIAALGGRTDTAAQINGLQAARRVSHQYRQHALRETLVDFSLQMELFQQRVLTNEWSRTHLFRSRRHLIADNLEEDNPVAHRLLREWSVQAESVLFSMDTDAGYRTFLGADAEGALELADACDERVVLNQSQLISTNMAQVTARFSEALRLSTPDGEEQSALANEEERTYEGPRAQVGYGANAGAQALHVLGNSDGDDYRYYPQMIRGVAAEVARLVNNENVAPHEIAIIAPIISDSLRFSLQIELQRYGIASTGHRPSRALEDEPATRTLLTLAKLAHPQWGLRPATQDVAQALGYSIALLDPVRANLLARTVYPETGRTIDLRRFGDLAPDLRRRVTYVAGEAYDFLSEWLYSYRAGVLPSTGSETVPAPTGSALVLDQFFERFFEEVLSQPGYGFRESFDAVRVAHQVVESARRLRWALEPVASDGALGARLGDLGREYVHLVDSGMLGGLYVPAWRTAEDSVLISPVPSFLLRNIAVRHQFWLDVGSNEWWERFFQPLTHPHILTPRWEANRPWQDSDETRIRRDSMRRQTLGLLRRATEQVHLAMSTYSETGYEQKGPLLRVTNRVIMQRQG